MELTNQELQDHFREYLDGEPIEWQLSRIFYSQNGGFARKTEDNERAIGFSQKDGAIAVDYIKLEETEDGTLKAHREDSIDLAIRTSEEYGKLKYLVNHAFETTDNVIDFEDPEHQDSMIS